MYMKILVDYLFSFETNKNYQMNDKSTVSITNVLHWSNKCLQPFQESNQEKIP